MTAEAILKAEQELKVTPAAPKINRAGPVVPETLPVATVPAATSPDPKPAGLLNYQTIFITKFTGDILSGKENDPANTTPTKVRAVSAVTSPEGEESEEKIKARAERFGGFQSDDAKKAARAAR